MNKSLIASSLLSLIYPAVYALAGRLFVLSNGRRGSILYHPTISSFYETGIITSLYEHLLMSPRLAHLEIRHEMPYHEGGRGAPKRVDLWIRPPYGGYAHLIEAGDFSVKKVHADLEKIRSLNPRGTCWFLAFFRGRHATDDPWAKIRTSLNRANGLNPNKVNCSEKFCHHFQVYRPDGSIELFAYALIRAR